MSVLPSETAPRRRPRWLPFVGGGAVVAVSAVVALVVLGGSSGSVADAATIVRATSARAASLGSSKVALDMTMSISGHTVHATGGGGFDYRRRVGFMSFDMAGLGSMSEVVTRKALYIRLPDALAGAMGSSRPWMEMRLSAMKGARVDFAKLMNTNPTGDPAAMLRMLSTAHLGRTDGTEDVRGVHTTRYSVDATMLDMMRAEGLTGAIDPSKLPPGTADTRMHVVVSVDKSGLARRMRMSMDLPGAGSMSMTMDMFDFGAPVEVMVPPRSVVTDITSQLTH